MTTMTTRRLLRVQDDAATENVRQARAAYEATIESIRGDRRFADAEKARRVVHETAKINDVISRQHADLRSRRSARYDELASLMPIGPGIAEGTSPADGVVLRQAWRAAYAEVQGQDRDGLQAALRDALRWGDDLTVRAVVTHASEHALTDIVDKWADAAGYADEMSEMAELRDTAFGASIDGLFEMQQFALVPPVKERMSLPQHEVEEAERLS